METQLENCEGETVDEVIYEVEKRMTPFTKFKPYGWIDKRFAPTATKDQFLLPDFNWSWTTDWIATTSDCDSDQWQYSSSLNSESVWTSSPSATQFFRRRRWSRSRSIKTAEQKAQYQRESVDPARLQAFMDEFEIVEEEEGLNGPNSKSSAPPKLEDKLPSDAMPLHVLLSFFDQKPDHIPDPPSIVMDEDPFDIGSSSSSSLPIMNDASDDNFVGLVQDASISSPSSSSSSSSSAPVVEDNNVADLRAKEEEKEEEEKEEEEKTKQLLSQRQAIEDQTEKRRLETQMVFASEHERLAKEFEARKAALLKSLEEDDDDDD